MAKILTTEEKARRYDEIIEKFDVILNLNTVKESGTIFADDVRKIITELKESEDERIRKDIVAAVETYGDFTQGRKEEIYAWLEKKSEQNLANSAKPCKDEHKPVDKVEPKFKVKYAGSEYNVFEIKDIAGVTFYGIEDEPDHIDYVKAEDCDIISGYGIKENGSPYPTKPAVFSEQKPTDKTEQKFHEGDWVILTAGVLSITLQIVKVDTNKKLYWFNDNSYLSIVDKDCLRLWTIQDAKDGDVLYSPCLSLLWIFKSRDTVYCGCNLNYNDGAFCGEGYFERPTDAIPATKIQRDILMKAMADAGWEFDFEKKELKKIAQKPNDKEMKETLRTEYEKGKADAIAEFQKEWSEEDEETIGWLCIFLKEYGYKFYKRNERNVISWLKSLKDRVGCEANCTTMWKPSEEQMMALRWVLNHIPYNSHKEEVSGLLEQLKKLKGE